ncbi:uracil-DNA glycosylase [Sporosarcina sp. FA9]|uniref:uracil-DNA glycosylase n=1 Tax=Sporosarcina sp. FA9 TaxID=3413030 RepID=UPI003F6566B5
MLKGWAVVAANCFECQHFFVTWEQQNPRGCRAHGFKSRPLPSVIVKQSSGMDCLLFQQKKGDKKR